MKKTKHQVQNLAKLKGSADAKKIWYTKTYLFMGELKQNGKRVVNDIMLLIVSAFGTQDGRANYYLRNQVNWSLDLNVHGNLVLA